MTTSDAARLRFRMIVPAYPAFNTYSRQAKVMTALVVISQGVAAGDEVTISARAASEPIGYTGQQRTYQGQLWTVEALMSFVRESKSPPNP